MKLFYKPGACSLASHIVLREAGKEFELARVDLAKKCLDNGDDFLAINPKGQIPALSIDANTLLTEGVAIMQYVADSAPKSDLLPPVGFLSRYKTLEWLNFVATELHKGFTPLFRPDTPEAFKPTARALLEKKLEYVDAALANQQWINGENFSIAYAYLFTVLRWAVAVKLNFPQAGNLTAYMQRVASRPAVAAAMAAEGI